MELNFYIYESSNEFFFVTLNCTHSLHGHKCLLRNKVIDHVHDIFSRILNFLMLILYCLNLQGLFIFLVHVPLNKKVSDTVFAVPYMYNLNFFNANAFYFCFLHNSMQPSFCLEDSKLTSFFSGKTLLQRNTGKLIRVKTPAKQDLNQQHRHTKLQVTIQLNQALGQTMNSQR